MRLRVTFPQVDPDEYIMPLKCPGNECESERYHRHGKKKRSIDDLFIEEVISYRYKCVGCGQTFWVHPTGISAGHRQSDRLKGMSVLLYVLGLSYGGVSDFLRASGAKIGKTSSYLNVQAVGKISRKLQAKALGSGVKRRAIGADGTYLKVKGEQVGIEVVVDPESGELLGLELIVSESADEIEAFIGEIAQQVGAEILVSDDLDSYKRVVQEHDLVHQICQTHIIRNVDKVTESIQEQLPSAHFFRKRGRTSKHERVKKDLNTLTWLVRDRPPDATQFLARLYDRYRHLQKPNRGCKHPPQYRLKMLILRLWQRWSNIIYADHADFLDGTNNASERAIGWWIKERYRTMRGYKRRLSIRNVVTLTAAMGAAKHYDMAQLYA